MSETCHRTHTLPDVVLGRLSEFVAARLGLHFPQDRWFDLERAVRGASQECGFDDTVRYVELLPFSTDNGGELEVLTSHLTVGETYFFRGQGTFEVVEKHILPTLAGRQPRIWSAGCATGEEPYSIAILMSRLIPNGNFRILATDLNTRSLRRAAEGIYGEWSFRGVPAWIREKYFSPCDEGGWAIDPSIKKMVTFQQLNLVEEALPGEIQAMDIIFCRNVMMYLHPAAVKKVADHLNRSLNAGGWLIVSPAEISHTVFSDFSPVVFGGATYYRKVEAQPTVPSVEAEPIILPEVPAPVEPAADCSGSATVEAPSHDADRVPAMLEMARACANQRELREALRWCEKVIATGEADSRAHYLQAAIFEEQGSFDAAARSLRRALYLDPKFAIGYFALGSLAARRGKLKESTKHFENALDVLEAYQPADILPEGDGLTAGQLRESIIRRKNG